MKKNFWGFMVVLLLVSFFCIAAFAEVSTYIDDKYELRDFLKSTSPYDAGYLNANVTGDADWKLYAFCGNATKTLYLNGHSISFLNYNYDFCVGSGTLKIVGPGTLSQIGFLEIEEGAELIIEDGANVHFKNSLMIKGDLTINGGKIVGDKGGQLYMDGDALVSVQSGRVECTVYLTGSSKLAMTGGYVQQVTASGSNSLFLSGSPSISSSLYIGKISSHLVIPDYLDPNVCITLSSGTSNNYRPVLIEGLVQYGNLNNFAISSSNPDWGIFLDADGSNAYFAKKAIISYDANGGTGSIEDQIVPNGVSTYLSTNMFSRPGYYVSGWNTNSSGTGDSYGLNDIAVFNDNTTLYAQWSPKNSYFSIDVIDNTSQLHMRGGLVQTNATSRFDDNYQTMPYGDCYGASNYTCQGDVTVNLAAVPNENYVFSGWYTARTLNANQQTLEPLELLSTDSAYSFNIRENNEWVPICAVFDYIPATFVNSDFVLPEHLLLIEENAFENIDASTIYVPDTCTEIHANAFKNCSNLLKIRLPMNCNIDATAFDGCAIDPSTLNYDEDCNNLLVIYAQPGGTTEEWALANHFIYSDLTD